MNKREKTGRRNGFELERAHHHESRVDDEKKRKIVAGDVNPQGPEVQQRRSLLVPNCPYTRIKRKAMRRVSSDFFWSDISTRRRTQANMLDDYDIYAKKPISIDI